MMLLQQFAAITAILMVFVPFQVFSQVTYAVPCDHTTTSCECPLQNEDGQNIEVCEFEIEISELQTFSRYEVNGTVNTVGGGGALWIINPTTGEFKPHPFGFYCRENTIPSKYCTDPFAVDGYTFKTFIATNGRIPAPTLIVNYNQILSVNVHNRLPESVVSIHWHGMLQRKTNFMDGAEHVTQCGITPQSSFRYIFQAAQTGTYWYHSHSGSQRTEGLFGALIIKENSGLIERVKEQEDIGEFEDHPDKHTLLFLDWQVRRTNDLISQYNTGLWFYDSFQVPSASQPQYIPRTQASDGSFFTIIPYWSGLINGKGRHENVAYVQSRLSIFTVSPDKQYRFRIIGAQAIYAFQVSIAEHKLNVIAVDGTFVKPKEVDFVIIHAGQRYDFLLETKSIDEISDGNNSFLIQGKTLETPRSAAHITEAILHYDITPEPGSTEYENIANDFTPDEERCTPESVCLALNCPFKHFPPDYNIDCIYVNELELLFPLDDSQLPDVEVGAEDQIFLNFAFEGNSGGASINARVNAFPTSTLALLNNSRLAALEEKEFCKDLNVSSKCDDDRSNADCVCTHIKKIPYNHSIQMVFSAVGPHYDVPPAPQFSAFQAIHSIHLHGHQFHVVDTQFGEYDDNGLLTRANDSIACGGTNVCSNPSWAEGKNYANGKSGKIPSTAPLVDTIFLPPGGYVVVYFKSDNPGYWFLHCHIQADLLGGMAVIISEAEDEHLPVPNGIDNCGNFDWTIEEFYNALNASPQSMEEDVQEDDDEDINELALGLGVGLGIALLLLLIVNVILLILFIFCCCIKRDTNKFHDI